VVRTIAISEDL
jgi:hypothetical protein